METVNILKNDHRENAPFIPSEGFMRLRQVLAVFPISRSAWYVGIREGRYPAPVKLGPKASAWRASDIRALIESVEG